MKTENESVSVQTVELARTAIQNALNRVRDDENIRYHMGAFTETFESLKAAHSVLTGVSEEAIEETVFAKKLRHKPFAEKCDEIKELIEKYDNGSDDKSALLSDLRNVLCS